MTRKRVLRAVAMVATAGLAVASLVALATDDLKGSHNASGLQVLSGSNGSGTNSATGDTTGGGPSATATASSGPSSSASSSSLSSSSLLSSSASSPSGAATASPADSSSLPPSSPSLPSLPSPSPSPSPGGGGSGPAPGGSGNVAVVSTLLQGSAFGSHVVLPLLCGVAIGAFGPALSDPNLAKLATTISSSCVTYGNEGQVAFQQMNKSLVGLAAINPTVDPLIAQMARMFNAIGTGGGVPFASSLIQLAQFISFFEGAPKP